MAETIRVEVAFATPERQEVVSLEVNRGSTIADVIAASGIGDLFPTFDITDLPRGIWGQKQSDHTIVKEGDRVEIYRPLNKEPMEARRERAAKKKK